MLGQGISRLDVWETQYHLPFVRLHSVLRHLGPSRELAMLRPRAHTNVFVESIGEGDLRDNK
jgi:hypothetical protein